MATIILTNPNDNKEYVMEYELLDTVTDHRGNTVSITDWHILNPTTQSQMRATKPMEIAEYLYDLYQMHTTNTYVQRFVEFGFYFLTDGCFSFCSGYTKAQVLNMVQEYMESYTMYRKPYHLWTRLWPHVAEVTSVSQIQSDLIVSSPEDSVRKLKLKPTQVQFTQEGSSSLELNCDSHWKGRQNYSFKMNRDTHNFFRHLDGEFYDPAYPQAGVPMFGLELELSTNLSCNELQYIVCEVEPKQEPFFIMKDDSSISGMYSNKVEIVTVPASPRYLKKAFSLFFKKLEDLCTARGKLLSDYIDLDTGLNNGIHIHVDRRSFHRNRSQTHIARFLSAFNLADDETAKLFSQLSRRPGDYRTGSYCSVDSSLKRYKTGYKLKEACHSGHRGTTSMRQSSTVEVRLFQGIVDINHIRTCIEATQAMLEYTHMMPLSTLNRRFAQGFKDFVLKSGNYNNLRKELK